MSYAHAQQIKEKGKAKKREKIEEKSLTDHRHWLQWKHASEKRAANKSAKVAGVSSARRTLIFDITRLRNGGETCLCCIVLCAIARH